MRMSIGAKLVEEYEKLLREGHGENCPWRNKSCDGTSPKASKIFHLLITLS